MVDPTTGRSGPDLSTPALLLARQSWGHGGDLGDIAYFVVRAVPGVNIGGAYQFVLYRGSDGYEP